jgi:peptidoglycan DL-endopeptidase CwlO
MSMIQDPSAPYRRNPRQIADEFNQTDPALNRPDTMSGQFQLAFNPEAEMPTMMSAAEQGATQTLQDVGQQNVRLQEENVGIANAAEAAMQRQRQAQQGFIGSQGNGGMGGSSYTGPAYSSNEPVSQQRQQLLGQTARYAGTRYQLGGRTAQGIDCSGLVMSVYNSMGFNIKSHSVSGQARSIPGVKTAVSNLKPGDLVVWNDSSHIAIYAGNGQIWDASRSKGTSLRPLWASPDKVYGIAVRLPGE